MESASAGLSGSLSLVRPCTAKCSTLTSRPTLPSALFGRGLAEEDFRARSVKRGDGAGLISAARQWREPLPLRVSTSTSGSSTSAGAPGTTSPGGLVFGASSLRTGSGFGLIAGYRGSPKATIETGGVHRDWSCAPHLGIDRRGHDVMQRLPLDQIVRSIRRRRPHQCGERQRQQRAVDRDHQPFRIGDRRLPRLDQQIVESPTTGCDLGDRTLPRNHGAERLDLPSQFLFP